MPKPTLVVTADMPNVPAPLVDLPTNQHIDHANVYQSETLTRLSGFDSGITALQGEMEGQQEAHSVAMEKLKVEYERQTAALTTEHNAKKGDLLRRIGDLQLGKAMAEAALDAWNVGKEK